MDVGDLCSVAGAGYLTKVKEYLKEGVDVNATFCGRTALNSASSAGHIDVVKCLLEKGANINHLDSNGRSSLWRAINPGHYHVARYLIDHGADVNLGRGGKTPLSEAVMGGYNKDFNPEFIEYLFERGARLTEYVFQAACSKGNEASLEILVNKGANVNSRFTDKSTPLLEAALFGNFEAVSLLLKKGASIDETDEYGMTALIFCAGYGAKNICKLLIEKGADTTIKDKDGRTAYVLATEKKRLDIVELLSADIPSNATAKDSSVASIPSIPEPNASETSWQSRHLKHGAKKWWNFLK